MANTIASKVIKDKEYRIISDTFIVYFTIKEIIITKGGRYKFIYDRIWTNISTGDVTTQKNIKSTSAVSGNTEIF